MELTLRDRGGPISVSVRREPDGTQTLIVDGETQQVRAALLNASTVRFVANGISRTARIVRIGPQYHVAIGGEVHVFSVETGTAASGHTGTLASPQIVAPMPGKVLQVLVREDQEVAAGDGLLILEAMKMENRILAEAPAVVRKVHVSEGQMIDGGTLLLELEYLDSD